MEEQVEQKTNKNLLTSSNCEGPRKQSYWIFYIYIGMGMVGFCFGIGLIFLAVKTEQSVLY